jgi:hypothetical protein
LAGDGLSARWAGFDRVAWSCLLLVLVCLSLIRYPVQLCLHNPGLSFSPRPSLSPSLSLSLSLSPRLSVSLSLSLILSLRLILLGPSGAEVMVLRAVRHTAVCRDLVRIWIQSSPASLSVTAEHHLLAQNREGRLVPLSAGDFVKRFMDGIAPSLFNGSEFCKVVKAVQFKQCTEVVEVCFENNACALAFLLPRRHRHSSKEYGTVAVLGNLPTFEDYGFTQTRTFIDSEAPQLRRSHSAGNMPHLKSCWSVGSMKHDDRHPERCDVCTIHHRFLLDQERPGSKLAKPCAAGAACMKCHALHPEQGGRMRRP